MFATTFAVTFGLNQGSDNSRKITTTLGGLAALAIIFSRLVLGVHGLNQVFYGAQIGLWLAITMN